MIPFFSQSHHWLNNASSSPLRYEGFIYPTVWHAYIAAKTNDYGLKRAIAAIPVGGQLSQVTAKVTQQIGFDGPKTMDDLLKIKFGLTIQDLNVSAQMHLAKKLIQTGLQVLEFGNHTCETNWGMCYCSRHTINSDLEPVRASGRNGLGEILMKIRNDWRVYVEEVNAFGNTCVLCSAPAKINVLYTQAKDPSFPLVVESCLAHQAQIFMKASSASSDRLIIHYNPDEKQEDIKSTTFTIPPDNEPKDEPPKAAQASILDIIKRYCPHCTAFVPAMAQYCPGCMMYIGHIGTVQDSYQKSSSPPSERQYSSEEFIC